MAAGSGDIASSASDPRRPGSTTTRPRPAAAGASIGPGTLLDVSFTGVATQYLVDVPGRDGGRSTSRISTWSGSATSPGDQVWISWNPGTRLRSAVMSALAHIGSTGAPGAQAPGGPAPEPTKRAVTAYLLLLPGVLWLLVFFVAPHGAVGGGLAAVAVPGLPRLLLPRRQLRQLPHGDRRVLAALRRSLLFAGLATLLAFVLAYPLAYAMAFKAGKWRGRDDDLRHRAVLHVLHPAHHCLAADPRR
jgi:hypothetical protein